MEKTDITLSLDSEKMDALAYYLKKENATAPPRASGAFPLRYARALCL